MDRDFVYRLALQAQGESISEGMWMMHISDLERFAALVAAHEREACAKVCEEFGAMPVNMSQAWRNGCFECATEIRARGNT